MKKLVYPLFIFIFSIQLFAKSTNPVFIGDFSPNFKDSITSEIKSGIYSNPLDFIIVEPNPSYCDGLVDMDDTISGCIWSSIQWITYPTYIVLPDFPYCTFHVLYRVKHCPNNPSISQIEIISFSYESMGSGCDTLVNYLNSGDELTKLIKLREIENDLYLAISEYEVGQIASLLPCDSLGNNSPQLVFYRREACTSKVLINIEYASVIYHIYRTITCNSGSGCCKTSISFCDSLGTIIPNILNNEPVGTPCTGYPIETDYEDLFTLYWQHHPDAVRITITPLPCFNLCN